jgi:hypothetical protein
MKEITEILGHHRWRGIGHTESTEITERRPSQMAIYGGRLKARNYTKFDSKLYKI